MPYVLQVNSLSQLTLQSCLTWFSLKYKSCFLLLLLNVLPVMLVKREGSSVTFIFLSSARVRVSCWGVVSFFCGSTVEMRGTFLAASSLPPSSQNEFRLLTYSLFSRWYPLKAYWRFSTRSRFVAASQRFIFRWKYRLISSFLNSWTREA